MAENHFKERRKNPRLDSNVPVKICAENGDIVTETANISRSGAYCRVGTFIEPMTKLQIQLLIPVKKNEKVTSKKITCGGVVVRAEEIPGENSYNVAIFFNDITAKDANQISEYVTASLEQDA